MERLNFQAIEKKWQDKFSKQTLSRENGKNFMNIKITEKNHYLLSKILL